MFGQGGTDSSATERGRLGRWRRRLVLVGNSRGGEVAWRFALDHSDRVTALVLVDSMGFPMELNGPKRVLSLPVLPRLLSRLTPRVLIRRSVRDVYGDPSRVSPDLVDRYHDLVRRAGNRDAHLELVRRDANPDDRYQELGDLTVPTLVLWGEADYWTPPWYGEDFRDAISGAELVTYEGVGHTPMEEIPEQTAADLAAASPTAPTTDRPQAGRRPPTTAKPCGR